jgi:hypothetical protein
MMVRNSTSLLFAALLITYLLLHMRFFRHFDTFLKADKNTVNDSRS